ncbi:NnrT protein [Parasedimentitalea maritima]|uniref:NnrT protein n=1 Tax=Parasedimentitalea maritima TaxID=2578117 RepID=A0A6A4RJB4_9RHOB|nr:NnrT protein [Zongyanglinia marina]KAE9630132.1 NnrT protein [Zongyanglinia marina]
MTQSGWPTWKITLALYPFGVGAFAVNVFFASLIGSWVGGPVLTTAWSLFLGALIALPATWYFSKHIRNLMDQADQSN